MCIKPNLIETSILISGAMDEGQAFGFSEVVVEGAHDTVQVFAGAVEEGQEVGLLEVVVEEVPPPEAGV